MGEVDSLVERGVRAAGIAHREAREKLSHIGQVHYSVRAWVERVRKIEREVLQSPFTMSSDIFPCRPSTFDSAAVAEEDRGQWGVECDELNMRN